MFSKTLGDLWRSRRVWSHLGWRDLRAQYARTGIGPWWSTATLLASIIGTSVAVQLISNGEFREIIPRLSLGLAIWTFWAICLTDGTNMFETERGLLLNTTISELALASRVVWRNILIFLHCSVVVIASFVVSGRAIAIDFVWFFVATILVAPSLILFTIAFGLLTLWKRDLKSILPAIIQVGFFVTPILWTSPRGGYGYLMIELNPVAWHLTFVRETVIDKIFRLDLLIRLVLLTSLSLFSTAIMGRRLQAVRKYL